MGTQFAIMGSNLRMYLFLTGFILYTLVAFGNSEPFPGRHVLDLIVHGPNCFGQSGDCSKCCPGSYLIKPYGFYTECPYANRNLVETFCKNCCMLQPGS